jgi:ParB-like chromosome segregation protein Spo0J
MTEDQPEGEFDFKMRAISELNTAAPFEGFFKIKQQTLADITADMQERGYDRSQPIIVWKGRDIVIDGHSRLQAAKKIGLAEVPVHEAHFDNEDEAFDYAVHNQRDRRNLTDAELHKLIQAVDQRKRQGERTDLASDEAKSTPGKSAAVTAEKLGISVTKAEQSRAVAANPEINQKVSGGELSIAKGAKEARAEKKAEATSEPATTKKTIAIKQADKALQELGKIPKDDPEYWEAFEKVLRWIGKQEGMLRNCWAKRQTGGQVGENWAVAVLYGYEIIPAEAEPVSVSAPEPETAPEPEKKSVKRVKQKSSKAMSGEVSA